MTRFAALLAAALLVLPALAQEPAWKDAPTGALVLRLGSDRIEDRLHAARFLRARGAEGRQALEHYLAPDLVGPAGERAPAPEGELRARVEELVARLASDEFPVRQDATRDLIGLGAAAIPLLRESAEASNDLEVKMRIARVLLALEGPAEGAADEATLRVEALSALVAFGSPESVPVLRRLVASEDRKIAELADAGLRMLSAAWPSPESAQARGSELLEAWDVALEKAAPVGGEPVRIPERLAERYPAGTVLRGRSATEFQFQLTGEMGAAFGADARFAFRARSAFTDRVDLDSDPPAVVRRYETYELATEIPGAGPGAAAETPGLAGETVRLPLEGGEVAGEDGTRLGSREGVVIERGLAILSLLPGGEIRPGETKVFDPARADQLLVPLLADEGSRPTRVLDAVTRVAYLGTDDSGHRRFRVSSVAAVEQEEGDTRALQRLWIAGEMLVDGRTGLVRRYRVEGPWRAVTRPDGAGSGELAMDLEGRIVSECELGAE